MLNLYDKEILKTKDLFSMADSSFYNKDACWPVNDEDQLILKTDMALDLGAGEAFGVSGILFTLDEKLVSENKIYISGPSINELAKVSADGEIHYARFVVIRLKKDLIENKTPQQLYAIFRKLDYVRYHFFPNGFSMRISTVQHREAVRVSKDAIKKQIDFEKIGNAFIKAYLELPEVESLHVYFLTATQKSDMFRQLDQISKKSNDITESLNEIFKGLKMDCSTCVQKPLCDEIEGLKELHSRI